MLHGPDGTSSGGVSKPSNLARSPCRSESSPSATSRTDPTTGRTPTEHERIKATVAIAKKAEEVGLDVFATGEHHNPPFIASNPTATLAYIGAQTERIILSTATTLITTTDPVLIAEDYAKIQHLPTAAST